MTFTQADILTKTGTTYQPSPGITVQQPASAVSAAREVAYAEQVLSSNITATTEATANTIVTAPAFSADGSTIHLVEFWSGGVRPDITAAAREVDIWLYEDGASIGRFGSVVTPASASMYAPVHLMRRLTPTSGSHTFSVRMSVNAGTAVFLAGAGGTGVDLPAAIRITTVVT